MIDFDGNDLHAIPVLSQLRPTKNKGGNDETRKVLERLHGNNLRSTSAKMPKGVLLFCHLSLRSALGPRHNGQEPTFFGGSCKDGKLMLGAFMLAGGVAGDIYGRRRVLVLGALGMVSASLLAAFAQTGGMLLVARALDGLASAAVGPMALALIASAFSQPGKSVPTIPSSRLGCRT